MKLAIKVATSKECWHASFGGSDTVKISTFLDPKSGRNLIFHFCRSREAECKNEEAKGDITVHIRSQQTL